jgi:hypothetical protein
MKKVVLSIVIGACLMLSSFSRAQSNSEYISNGLTLKVGDTIQVGIVEYSFNHIKEPDGYGGYKTVDKDRNLVGHKCVVYDANVKAPAIKNEFSRSENNNLQIISFGIGGNVFYADAENAFKSGEFIIKMNPAPMVDRLTEPTAFAYFVKDAKMSPDLLVEEYLYRYMHNLYKTSHDDEFESQNALSRAKEQLVQNIEQCDTAKIFSVREGIKNYSYVSITEYIALNLGNYDFVNKGFPLQEKQLEFEIIQSEEDDNALLSIIKFASIDIVFLNFKDFRFVKVPENEASALLKRRKGTNGEVDRKVYATIIFSIVKSEIIKPKPSKKTSKKTDLEQVMDLLGDDSTKEHPRRVLYGKIESIELYEFQKYRYNWIGTLK